MVRGSSMAPLINDGDIVAVDCAQRDPERLNGKIIVTLRRDSGLELSRFHVVNGKQGLQAGNRHKSAYSQKKTSTPRIIGRAMWWIRKTS